MSEFSSLNGFDVKDKIARNIAKGRNQAVAFENYSAMVTALNSLAKGEYNVGQNIYIVTVGVPDLWVSSVESIVHNFEYVSDEDIVQKLEENGTIQCGYYKLSMLEGQKVDLTSYDEAITGIRERFTNVGGTTFVRANDQANVTNMENTKFVPMYADDYKIADIDMGSLRDVISNVTTLNEKTLVNGWAGQLASPKEYELEPYGRAYLVVISTVGGGNVGASDMYLVVTAPDTSGAGLVTKLHGNNSISVTLSANKLTISASTTAIWLNIAVKQL